ncbi:MAG: gamma-glutamyl-gamma-aminobutyrate hydrolase family protein [Rikenellaceae bacterium]
MASSKPIVGVVPLWDDERSSIWMLPAYLDLITEAGGVPIIFPLKAQGAELEQLCRLCSGFLLTGGHDVDPAIYNQRASDKCGATSRERDTLERAIFNYALEHDAPVLGICRGIQLINALLVGTLYQDLPSEHISDICHQMSPPYDSVAHRVRVVAQTPLSSIVPSLELGVNSYHHQAVKELAPSLQPMALSEDGLVEAVYMPSRRFVQAYQWHPEFNFRVESSSLEITKRFIEACRE